MTPREHFKNVDAFYINRFIDEDRRNKIETNFEGIFKSLTRVEPVKFEDMKAQGIDYKRRLVKSKELDVDDLFRGTMFADIDIDRFANRKPKPTSSTSPYTPIQYACAESAALTVKLILTNMLESGLEHVMILEDDACPRWEVLDDVHDIPEGDMILWGMYMHNVLAETKLFKRQKNPTWRKMKPGNGCFGAHAWEVTRTGAIECLKLYDEFPAVINDVNRQYLFNRIDCYGLYPTGIIQRGDSTISKATIHMALTREEAVSIVAEHDKRVLEHRNRKLERQKRDMQILQEV